MSIFAPLQFLADWLTYSVLPIKQGTLLASSVNFFLFDTAKIFLLLAVIIFLVSFIRTFLPPEKIRLFLTRRHTYVGNILAALLGVLTPFCSCSAVPLFLGFVEAGVPLGITFSFLVSSPMVNEVAIILLLGMFGWKIALLYAVSGIVVAVFSGIIIGKLKVENLVEEYVWKLKIHESKVMEMTRSERVAYARSYTVDILKRVWLYVVIGIGLGAWIHGYVPTDFLVQYAGSGTWYAVPLAVLVGIPLYSNAAGVIPLVSVLTEKGVSIGTALAFMMAVTALSLPEFLILRKVMKVRLLVIFASVVGIGIIAIGYLFNAVVR